MLVISGASNPDLAEKIAYYLKCQFVKANTEIFLDLELRVCIDVSVKGEEILLVQSTTKPANDHLMELLLLADTVRRAGAKRVVAVIPYYGYGRQDRPSYQYGPISAKLVASLLKTVGIDHVITVDLHSCQSEGFFDMGVSNLDLTNLMKECIHQQPIDVILSPDIGGMTRAKKMAEGLGRPWLVMQKTVHVQI